MWSSLEWAEDHDANLVNFLNICQEEGLILNTKKLELHHDRVSFFEATYGVEPDPYKIQGIEEMTPTDKQQLQSFLVMVTYMVSFVPYLSHHMEPLRQLLKRDTTFYWDDLINWSFQQIKELLWKAQDTPLRYNNWRKPITVQANSPLIRLTACLILGDRPITFARKLLTGTDSRYANIERELLTMVFACIWFNIYL